MDDSEYSDIPPEALMRPPSATPSKIKVEVPAVSVKPINPAPTEMTLQIPDTEAIYNENETHTKTNPKAEELGTRELLLPDPMTDVEVREDDVRFEQLKRQAETMTKLKEQSAKAGPSETVPFSKLMTPATAGEKTLIYISYVAAVATGIGQVLFVLFISQMFNSFGPKNSGEETLKSVTYMYAIMIGSGAFLGLSGFTYWYISKKFADIVARRTKENFLAAILTQESAWFDANNYNELASRMTKESMAICKACGEKPGSILTAISMCMCGLAIGFTQGWSLALT